MVAGAPAAYFSTLPIKAMVRDLRAAGVPAAVSNSAGTFVCNHLFFGLMHRAATRPVPRHAGGFIHIPYLPEQVARLPGQPSMALADAGRRPCASRCPPRSAVEATPNARETGGQLH